MVTRAVRSVKVERVLFVAAKGGTMTLYESARPLLFALPAETAHNLGKRAMASAQSSGTLRRAIRYNYRYRHPMLEIERFGLPFESPVGWPLASTRTAR